MDRQEWVKYVQENKDILINFVQGYHPGLASDVQSNEMPITAKRAEAACEVVRAEYREKGFQLSEFVKALEEGDVYTVYQALQAAWIGVPESTACWSIQGYREAVGLLEDPPK